MKGSQKVSACRSSLIQMGSLKPREVSVSGKVIVLRFRNSSFFSFTPSPGPRRFLKSLAISVPAGLGRLSEHRERQSMKK